MFGKCKFGDYCQYKHVENKEKRNVDDLELKVKDLEASLLSKECEINQIKIECQQFKTKMEKLELFIL